MSKKTGKKSDSTVSDAMAAREADHVVTADELVTEPEAPETINCPRCTADMEPGGICPNCGYDDSEGRG